ncbi:MAG: hypothetical protein KDD45_15205 [Bdellovibrionales bacterium]|nr:hypothetical protein [Bdellovibrionales bacterium]
MVDCVYSRSGCEGGWVPYAFDWIKTNDRGIGIETDYAYTGTYGGSCLVDGGAYKISGYVRSRPNHCSDLINKLKVQPLSVGVVSYGWSSYSSGVFGSC